MRQSPSIGRKRIQICKCENDEESGSNLEPTKRRCAETPVCLTESLPPELVVRIVCGVDHDDLKCVACVNERFAEAVSIAKEMHFKYKTPTKIKTFGGEWDGLKEKVDVLYAPKKSKSRRNPMNFSGISTSLVFSP